MGVGGGHGKEKDLQSWRAKVNLHLNVGETIRGNEWIILVVTVW